MSRQDSFIRKYGDEAGPIIYRYKQKLAVNGKVIADKNARIAALEAEVARLRNA
jgi:hypothetical protein